MIPYYCAKTGSLHIGLQPRPGIQTWEFSEGLNADHDENGTTMSKDISQTSPRIESAKLATMAQPLRHLKAA